MARGNYYVIVSNETDFVAVEMGRNEGYAELLEKEKNRELKSEHPTVVPRACLKQTPDMLLEDYTDEETGVKLKKFREEVVVARGNDDGRIWVDGDKPELARRLLRTLRKYDKTVHLDPEYKMLEEEMTEAEKKRAAGGRPSRAR